MARSKKKKKVGRVILLSVLFLTLLTALLVTPFLMKLSRLKSEAEAMVAASSELTFKSQKTTLIFDRNGDKIANMQGEKILYYIELSEIPQALQDAFLVMEDRKFYNHRGVDFFAVVRASLANYSANAIEQGASTITQQLARNIFLTQEVTWQRKIQEMYVALALERTYSKEKILEFYLNNIYFANGYYGVEAAARGYFSCSAKELSLSQLVFLSAIPNNPSKYDPLVRFESVVSRRNVILSEMLAEGAITKAQYEAALAEEIVLNQSRTVRHNYVETYVKYCATEEMMRVRGFSFRYDFSSQEDYNNYMDNYHAFYSRCQQELFQGGYSIYTSIDMEKQRLLQEQVDQVLSGSTETNEEGTYALQGAAVCIDNETGNVVAVVGGRDQNQAGYTLNRAYQSYRQSGSSIKPLSVYMPYLMQGNYPSSVILDAPIPDGPENPDKTYLGEITVTDAVRYSRNTTAWRAYQQVTSRVGTGYLLQMEFKKVYADKDRLTGALGGFTYGVTPEEMAGGYAAIANDGMFRSPTCIAKIVNAGEETVVDTSGREKQVYDANASRMMQAILKVTLEDGTAAIGRTDKAIAAAKTGTTNDDKDYWFAGFSRYYTTSVWVGYDLPRTMGYEYAGQIWKGYMDAIHENLPLIDFEDYDHTAENEWLAGRKEPETETEEESSAPVSNPKPPVVGPGTVTGESQGTAPPGEVDASGHPNGEWDAGNSQGGEWNAPGGTGGEWDVQTPPGEVDAQPGNPGEWDAG